MSGRLVAALPRTTPQEATTLGGDNNTRSTERVTRSRFAPSQRINTRQSITTLCYLLRTPVHTLAIRHFSQQHIASNNSIPIRGTRVYTFLRRAQCHLPWLAPRPLRSHYLVGICRKSSRPVKDTNQDRSCKQLLGQRRRRRDTSSHTTT